MSPSPDRSHYHTLGIAPGAAPEAIRRAYLRQARLWHPDRPSGDAEKMRAVNEAWQILGNPRSRSAYDQSRARRAPVRTGPVRPTGPFPAGSGPRPPGRTPAGEHSSDPAAPPLEMVGFRWRWISLAAVALVAMAIVLIFWATSATENPGPAGSAPASAPVSRSLPEPGDCFLFGTTTLIWVGCDHPHDGQLVDWVSLGAPLCAPGTQFHWVRAVQRGVCYRPVSG